METIRFRVLNNAKNVKTALANGIYTNKSGRFIEVEISPLQFPYLQGNIAKIKKAMGF